MKNFLKSYYSWNNSLWLQNKASVLHKQKTHEMKWKKLLTRVFTYKCLKLQLKPLLVSKEWMLIIIMLEMHTIPLEFKQVHQRGNSGFQTARIILHWCELYESHLSNAKFLEPVSFLLRFSSITICLSCFHVMPEKTFILKPQVFCICFLHEGLFHCVFWFLNSILPACGELSMPLAVHWGLLIYGGESCKYTISFFKNRTFTKRFSGLLNQAQQEDCQISV